MVQRASRGISKELDEVLEQLRADINSRIADVPTEFQRKRLGTVLASVESILQGGRENISQRLTERLNEFTDGEIEFQKETLDQVLNVETTVPPIEKVQSAVTSTPTELLIGNTKQTMTVNQMVETFSKSNTKEIKNLISTGFIAGDTTDQIAARVSQKVRGRTRAQARTVVQTAVNHAAGVARKEFSEENSDKIGGEKYLATLDARTTPTCSGLDGNIYEVGVGPKPPLHYNCRSLRVAVPREGSVLSGMEGSRPAVGADGVEQVTSNKTFSGWLRGQPADFKREFFRKYRDGQAKYELFEQGGLDAKAFIDADGAEISLQELREKNPLAWQKAGVSGSQTQTLTTGQRLAQQEFDIGKSVPVGQKEKMNSLFGGSSGTRRVAMALDEFPDKVEIHEGTKGPSFYNSLTGEFKSTNSKKVFTHEYGHFVDYRANKVVDGGYVFRPISAKRGLRKALEKDAKNLGLTSKAKRDNFISDFRSKFFDRKTAVYTKGPKKGQKFGDVYRGKTENSSGVSDIFDAATKGKVRDEWRLPGHGKDYFKISEDTVDTETFANMFQIYGSEEWDYVKSNLPEASKVFEGILSEIENRG